MAKVRKAVLPVAGLGTRFLPATKAMPKEMLTVVDKPLIQYAVEEAIAAGITEIIFVTGRGKTALENHFDRPYELVETLKQRGKTKELELVESIIPSNCRIYYTRQGEPRGLGHAIWCAKELIGDEPFAVLLPDDIIWSPEGHGHALKEMCGIYEETGQPVVLTSEVPMERTKNYGILDIGANKMTDGRVKVQGFVEKPGPENAPSTFAITGRYVLPGSIMQLLESAEPGYGGEIQITDAMDKIAQETGFYGYLNSGQRFDCGDKVGFQLANLFFAQQDPYIAGRLKPFLKQLVSGQIPVASHATVTQTTRRDLKLAVIGTGYVGLVSGTCFAEMGFTVTCIDNDAKKIEALTTRCEIPIYEPGLSELVASNSAAGRLLFSTDLATSVADADVVFIAVGTPQDDDGSANLSYVYAVAEELAPALSGYTVVVDKSTVPVGTASKVAEIIRATNPQADFDVVSNPEFLREGNAIGDFMRPDRVVVGATTPRARETMETVYAPLTERGYNLQLTSSTETAELIKYAANGFLAMKISFINEITRLCEAAGANVRELADGLGQDTRIGRAFLNPGPGYGGSCFPKDTQALAYIGRQFGTPLSLIEATIATNTQQRAWATRKITATLGPVKGLRLAALGLAFKGNTDDMRESPAVSILRALQQQGAIITAFDPAAMENAAPMLPGVTMADSVETALTGADAALILTEWPEFSQILPSNFSKLLKSPVVIDLRNLFNPATMAAAGLTYVPIGQPAPADNAPAKRSSAVA